MSQRQTISDLAYHLWQARGCPHGSSTIDWEEAERQVTGLSTSQTAVASIAHSKSEELDESLSDTFPASDPVASHLPADVPSNADEKWANAGKEKKRRTRR